MEDSKQNEGRTRNSAMAGGRPDETTPDRAIKQVGRQSTRKAGPDGPSSAEVGDTFKRRPEH